MSMAYLKGFAYNLQREATVLFLNPFKKWGLAALEGKNVLPVRRAANFYMPKLFPLDVYLFLIRQIL